MSKLILSIYYYIHLKFNYLHFIMEANTETHVENNQENTLDKIRFPKRKYVMIHGYNGHNYSGNQKYI